MNCCKYKDIINLPHHVSTVHPPMSARDRAAQFSPFAALTGYDAAIRETARYVSEEIQLDADEESLLNEKIVMLHDRAGEHPEIRLCYFEPDEKKAGGAYINATGQLKRVDPLRHRIIFNDGLEIEFKHIYSLESDFFGVLEL